MHKIYTMRLNWGTSLVIAIITFIAFILFFVIQMLSNEHSQDLVKEAYYHDELMFQQEIDNHKKTISLRGKFKLIPSINGLNIIFPEDLEEDKIKGKITLYRPSNKKLDTSFNIQLNNLQQLIGKEYLLKGRWNILIDFDYNGEAYSYKEEIVW